MKTLKMVHIKKSNKRWGPTGKQASSSFCPLGLGLGGGGAGEGPELGRKGTHCPLSVCSAFFLISSWKRLSIPSPTV